MIRYFIILLLFTFSFPLNAADVKRPSTIHKVYFKGSDYELHVYKIYGRRDGKTMLIVGGIQGDEPGGFLSADLYSELTLEQGNLIVVPRANFKSIILFNRGVDGDMNRIFHKNKIETDMDKVVSIIKNLMSESDIFLHLHDGWGFHNPKYIDNLRNPKRFGQSIITDADEFKCKNGKVLPLRDWAYEVLEEVNEKIADEQYFMHYFNTNTEDPKTSFKDMRKTATYYALKTYCIPAFGIEASKNLPTVEMKVLHHNYAVNAFMKLFNIIPEQPQIFLPKPEFKYVVLQVNGEPHIIENNKILYLSKNSLLEVIHIESNYKRGLSCDVLGVNGLNDMGIPVKITKDTEIIFRKDNKVMGRIFIKISKSLDEQNWVFIVEINGKKRAVMNGEKIVLKKGDVIKLLKVFSEGVVGDNIKINFKGFVPSNVVNNTGDDRGYKIIIDSNFMKKYSLYKDKEVYPVVAKNNNITLATFYIEIRNK
ncbi:M14/M99 family metallopeptidase [Deferribacter abyssi]|uniref:M14/M99 family metallopeptidase n=1 Tax=Deferribacter abyssi TaxID=213806 RepID=UPI003C248E28